MSKLVDLLWTVIVPNLFEVKVYQNHENFKSRPSLRLRFVIFVYGFVDQRKTKGIGKSVGEEVVLKQFYTNKQLPS